MMVRYKLRKSTLLGSVIMLVRAKFSAIPVKLPGGQWNCSVPNWPDFRPHLACNLITQCADAEDEIECGYELCRSQQGFLVENSCYVIKNLKFSFRGRTKFPNYYDAHDYCTTTDGSLASFSSEKRWRFMTGLLEKHLLSPNLHVGLIMQQLNAMYTFVPFWDNGIAAYQTSIQRTFSRPICGFYSGFVDFLQLIPCFMQIKHLNNMCEYKVETSRQTNESTQHIQLVFTSSSSFKLDTVLCPQGHYTHTFLACDVQAVCFSDQGWSYTSPKESWDIPSPSTCPVPHLTSLPPSFLCATVTQRVPYSLVCNHQQDCQDNSDEFFCLFLPCPLSLFSCGNLKQCYSLKQECDGVYDCLNGADETQCWDRVLDPSLGVALPVIQPPPPSMITLDGKGKYKVESLHGQPCPHTHFWCLSDNYCLPVYVRCNGLHDCPGREDEQGCKLNNVCPGFYRCRSSSICLHPSHVCDGVFQCPQRDDELWCDVTCPQQCQCWGLAFVCGQKFSVHTFSDLRYVDARGSGMTLQVFAHNLLLIHLGLARCGLAQLDSVFFNNLNSLDLSNNVLESFNINHFKHLPRLKMLILTGNPFSLMFQNFQTNIKIVSVQYLDLSFIDLPVLDTNDLIQFVRLEVLNLSGSKINQIGTDGFNLFKDLRVLDVKGCQLSQFPENILKGLPHLQSVYTDNFKLCCEATLPEGFNLNDCYAPFDEVSSCEALLRSDTYRVLLSFSAVMSLIGNLATFTFRLLQQGLEASGFQVFVTNLCVADFLMGVYLSIIGVADRVYLGTYLWEDTRWRHSAVCTMAGFLSLLSCEVSVFIICLITLDRFLVLRFPFSHLRFHRRAAQLVSTAVWAVNLLLASVPLFPQSPFQELYNQVGICIPLPITRKEFQGDNFVFGIMIALNFVLFMLIAVGQGMIYLTIRASAMAVSDTGRQSQDLNIARRLITVAVSDFLCWFPIGLLGLLATQGVPIPGELNVTIATLVIPINSVINPFLYTFNVIMEKRRKVKEANLLKWLKSPKEVPT